LNRSAKSRRSFIRGVVAAGLAARWSGQANASSADRRPNVLMIVADDQRSDMIAALGNPRVKTPNLDRLANEGFNFSRARCMGAQVGAVCIAARAMIHTGRSMFRAPHNLPARIATMPETFRKAGYSTFGCGKWHNERASFARGFGAAGNVFFGGMNGNQYRVRVHREFDPTGVYDPQMAGNAYKFSSELFADAAVDFLGTYKQEAPFFAYCAFTSPHDPRTPPPPYSTMYDPARIELPKNFLPGHPFDNGELKIRDEMLAPFPRTEADTRKQLCDYYGMVSSQDEQVGRILQALHNSGRAENTIVLYTGDHGLAIGSHGLFGKQNVYEHSVGVPMIFHGPGISHGQSDALVYGMDLFPTLCQYADVASPSGVEGHDLSSIMHGSAHHVRDFAFHAYIAQGKKGSIPRTQHAIREERWKYIRYRVEGKTTTQLFDLAADPFEINDLAKDAASVSELARLEKLLGQTQDSLDEPAGWKNA